MFDKIPYEKELATYPSVTFHCADRARWYYEADGEDPEGTYIKGPFPSFWEALQDYYYFALEEI